MKSPAFQLSPSTLEVGAPVHGEPSVFIHAKEFILYTVVNALEAKEIGQIMQDIASALKNGDYDAVSAYPFITRVLKGYKSQLRPPLSTAVRRRVLSAGCCAKCGSTRKLEVDHIIPWSKGGTHEEINLQCLCKKCNRTKYNKMEDAL